MRTTIDASRVRFENLTDEQVDSIYNDDYVKEQYRNDLDNFVRNNNDNSSYIGAFVDGDLAGMFYCTEISSLETEVHLAFYKDYRYHVKDICKYFIEWMLVDNNVKRITTFVYDYRRTVVNMLLKLGFKYEGYMANCAIKDGILYGKHVLGVYYGRWR